MEPDVLGQAETTADTNTSVDSTVSEDVKTPDTTEVARDDKGDFKTAMYEERKKRQELEQKLTDPNYIYELAKQHGMTNEEAQAEAEAVGNKNIATPPLDINKLVDQSVKARLDYEESVRMMPEIAKDEELQAWAASLVNKGKTHVEAVKIIQKRLETAQKDGESAGMQAAKTTISEKERASTATTPIKVSESDAEESQLRKEAQNRYDKKAQEKAVIELMKRKNKAAGIQF